MIISLVSRGVVSGLCLVLAKYWYDRREGKGRSQAANANQSAGPEVSDIAAGALESAAVQTISGGATDAAGHAHQPSPTAATYRSRKGGPKDDDERVAEALASRDLSTMDTLLQDISDPVLRNRLLKRLVTGHYRFRSDAYHRAAFYRAALLQMEEASSILEGIEEIGEPRPESLEAFKSMAITLDEDGSPDGAIAVCEMALSLGLQDGTKSGFEGRIDRLRQRQKRTGAAGSVNSIKTLH